MKRVLLTGACGFVGRWCVPALLARGYEVHAVGHHRVAAIGEESSRYQLHDLDLLDAASTDALVKEIEPTHLLHLAWYTAHGKFWTATENLRWVGASLALFESFAACGGRRVVAAGTCAEYAPPLDGPCSESATPLAPATLYGACKHALHVMLEAFARQAGMSAAWGRLFFPYGPDEPKGRLVPSVARSLLAGEPARCTHGEQVRDFIHVEDAAAAFVALLDSEVEGAVNVASGHPVALKEVIAKIASLAGRPDLVRLGELAAPAGEPSSLWADVSRLHDEISWSPHYSLDEGLGETIQWWRAHLSETAGEGR